MIQELFRGTSVSILTGEGSSIFTQTLDPLPSSSISPSSYVVSDTATTITYPPPAQNLRCPRCDSPNTKFVITTTTNLTQPRHFCKTCRRYWTKGAGALRNVPIGGSYRKNKPTPMTSIGGKSSSGPGKSMKMEIGNSTFSDFFDQSELHPNPSLWPSTHHSHLLSLFRQNPNTYPNQNLDKEHGPMFGSSYFTPCEQHEGDLVTFGSLQVPSIGLGNSSYKNKEILLGETENNNGLQEPYQKLSSSTSSYLEHAFLRHMASSGLLNPTAHYWQPNDHLHITNGAYP